MQLGEQPATTVRELGVVLTSCTDVVGVAYLSLAPVSSGKTQAACHDTLFVAVDTRSCSTTAPVKGQ